MREILFKGKQVDNGEWVEGYYLNQRESLTDKKACYIATNNGYGFNYISVIPETVCQFTELYDKNGRKIFENDIVRLMDEYNEIEWTAVVVFGNPNGEYNWGWQLKAIGEFDGNKDILLWVDIEESGTYCEIIGNIHDKKLEDFENGC